MTSQFSEMMSSLNFFGIALFLLSHLVTGPSFVSMSSMVLELWQFPFIRDWLEIKKLEIPPSVFCPISRGWSELGIPNLTWAFLNATVKCYWMLQNPDYNLYCFWLIKGKTNRGEGNYPPPTQIRVNLYVFSRIII